MHRMAGLRSCLRLFLGLAFVGLSGASTAQSLRFVGTANNIEFPAACATSSSLQINLPAGAAPLTATATCNGVAFNCRPATLPGGGGAVSTVGLKSGPSGTSTVNLTCTGAATITGLQTSINRFHQSIQDFNAGNTAQQVSCVQIFDRVVASNPSAVFTADREYRYTCVNSQGGGSPQAVGCFVVDRWSQGVAQAEPRFLRWNAQGTAVLVDDCINSLGPGGALNSPYIFADGAEEETTREAQTINFPQPPAQTFSTGGSFRISASATPSGLPVTFTSTTPTRCSVSGELVTILSAGIGAQGCSITASQGGNSQWQPAQPVTRVIDINRAPQTITFNPPTSVSSTAQTFTWPAPTGGGSNNPVVVTSLSPDVCTISSAAGNTAIILAAGKCDLVANQAGNVNYLLATVNRSVSISPPPN
jgi:hypothetical protein